MAILAFHGRLPSVAFSTIVFPTAVVAGDVTLAAGVSVWHGAVVRGDMAAIAIGEDTNVQDNAVIHVNDGLPTVIGARVTIGHGAIVHAARIGDDVLVGMGSVILDGAVVGDGAIIGAGALVPPGKFVPPRTLVVGNPMTVLRAVSDVEVEHTRKNAARYRALATESLPAGGHS